MFAKLWVSCTVLAVASAGFAQDASQGPPAGLGRFQQPQKPAATETQPSGSGKFLLRVPVIGDDYQTASGDLDDLEALTPTLLADLPPGSNIDFYLRGTDDNRVGYEFIGTATDGAGNPLPARELVSLRDKLNAIVGTPARVITPFQRDQQKESITDQLAFAKEVLARQRTPLIGTVQEVDRQFDADRAELSELEKKRDDLMARQSALETELDRLHRVAEEASANDQIVQKLQELVKIRQDAEAQIENMINVAAAQVGSSADAQAAVADAEIRLAERKEELSKSAKGELLDRLSDELAMLSVDVQENDIKLKSLQDRRDSYLKALSDPNAMQALMKEMDPLSGATGLNDPAILEKLEKQITDLQAERLALEIGPVGIIREPGSTTEPATDSSPPGMFHPPGAPPGVFVPVPNGQ